MSKVVNMVGGGSSGGGISANDAVLLVTVPTGSTVTATKGGVALTPTIWVTAADPTLDCAIFSIKSSLFDAVNPWTVTATLGAKVASDAVTVSENKEYSIAITPRTPAAYQAVEFLESTGAQYIFTDIFPADVASGSFEFYKTADVSYAFLWGAGSDSNLTENEVGFRASMGGSQYAGFYYNANGVAIAINTRTDYSVAFSCSSGAQSITCNGSTYSGTISGSVTNSYKIALFAFNYGGTIKTAEICKCRLKSIVFYNSSNEKIMEMIPCYRKSDSVAGMWDTVSDTFHTNSGTGSFVVGSDV